jgi:putative nucleotidyltransferase with HDIG domain
MDPRPINQQLASKLNIPSLPEVIVRLNELIDRGDVRMSELGGQLALDPPLAAKALRIANSAYFGLRVPVESIEHAASVLGMRSLKSMVMQALVLDLFRNLESIPDFDPREVWKRSVVSSRVAMDLPRRKLGGASYEDLQLCGLLHDIGEFVLVDHFGEQYSKLRKQVEESGEDLVEAEERVLGVSHVELGALVAQIWKLPDSVARVAEFHHDLEGVAARDPLVAHIAYCDAIVEAARNDLEIEDSPDWLPHGPRELLGYRTTELEPCLRRARMLWGKSA